MNLPTLFKKTSTGAIQFWDIEVIELETCLCPPPHVLAPEVPTRGLVGVIITRFGQVGTTSPQETRDVVASGKNPGKKNETTPFQQAEAEAKAKWEKQKKKGYVESKEAAEKDELDALIEGGIVPMLAHKFAEQGHKIKYPAYVQPKLDGIRCIAILKDGKCTLWSRTRKPITGVPHIQREIESNFTEDLVLDGELYNHDLKANFEKIVSMVRQEEPAKGHEIVQYHVYDMVNEDFFAKRSNDLFNLLSDTSKTLQYLRYVPTSPVKCDEDVTEAFEKAKAAGFEGAMLRNAISNYVNKRSYDLQKVKEFDDAEFPIVGVEEGRGKLAGHAIFVCRTGSGKEFLAKMRGETSKLKEFFDNRTLWNGKLLTVQYQGLTGKEGVPRFPVGVAIRDYE